MRKASLWLLTAAVLLSGGLLLTNLGGSLAAMPEAPNSAVASGAASEKMDVPVNPDTDVAWRETKKKSKSAR